MHTQNTTTPTDWVAHRRQIFESGQRRLRQRERRERYENAALASRAVARAVNRLCRLVEAGGVRP